MGTKFRGLVVPSCSPVVRQTFDSIQPRAPMCLVAVSRHILGVGFAHMTPGDEEFDRLGAIFSRAVGLAAMYWCHSSHGDGYTLYEDGRMAARHYDEHGPLAALPFPGASFDELQQAFGNASEVLAWNIPSLTSLVEQLDGGQFKPGLSGRKNALLKKAQVIHRRMDDMDAHVALLTLGNDFIASTRQWLHSPPTVLIATIEALMDSRPRPDKLP